MEKIKQALWALHEAAQDAANDPTTETLRAVDKAHAAVRRAKPLFYWEQSHPTMPEGEARALDGNR